MILTVAIPTPLRRLFDYLPPENQELEGNDIVPGVRVKVPFGNRSVIGLVLEMRDSSEQPATKLKPVLAILDVSPLVPPGLLDLIQWAAAYYQHPVGDAVFSALPALIRKGHPIPELRSEFWQLTSKGMGLAENSLKRAPKQQGLVRLLDTEGPVTADAIKAKGFSLQTLKILEEKELAEPVFLDLTPTEDQPLLAGEPLHLRREQQQALANIAFDHYCPSVLYGDTGTGKTEVYLQAIEKVLRAGKQALILVPEISLTPQTLDRFRQRFNCPVLTLHSKLTDRERLQAWTEAREGQAKIIVGTRSAVFTPMARLGIIVIDEEHDLSFKQQEGFRYSARDVAVMRANKARIPIILGSATPSLETLNNCLKGRYRLLKITERGESQSPIWKLVDIRGASLQGGLAAEAITAMEEHLSAGHQVLVFLNRRGYAPVMLCHDCGWQAQCTNCTARLTAHIQQKKLVCHHCEWQCPIPHECPMCRSPRLQYSGQGTERCEESLAHLFPGTPVLRIDRDSTRRKGAMDKAITDIKSGKPCILVGTQMLAKGHHFPSVSLAVLVDVDGGLFSTDFRAIERTAQMIVQVAGRAGRGSVPGQIYLQSHYCDHPLLQVITRGGYSEFSTAMLEERKQLKMPPYTHLALFRADAIRPGDSEQFLQKVRRLAEQILVPSANTIYIGPLPGAIEKRRNHYRFTLLINSVNRADLATGLKQLCNVLDQSRIARNVKWSLDIDPQEML